MWARAGVIGLLLGGPQGCLWISAAEHVRRTDQDGDGHPTPDDCDDHDPARYPGAIEVPCDDVDNDCNANSADGPAAIRKAPVSSEVVTVTYDSIPKAMLGAHPGDTLVVCTGRWFQQLVITVPNLTVTGSGVTEATVFDASGLELPAVEIQAADVTIENLTIENGVGKLREELGTWGGGVYAYDAPGKVTLNQVLLTGNSADQGGGVVGPAGAELVVKSSTIRANTATSYGGGVYVPSSATVTDTVLTENTAEDQGGGLAVAAGGSTTLLGTTEIRANTARSGAGVLIGTNASLTGGLIVANTAAEDGGGGVSAGGDLTDVTFAENKADHGGGLSIFGGIVTRGIFRDNTARDGGGMYVTGNVDVRGTRFEADYALDGDGGAILVVAGLLTTATDGVGTDSSETVFDGCAAEDSGGAIAAVGGSLDVSNGEMTECLSSRGGGIAIVDTGDCPYCTYALNGLRLIENGAVDGGGGVWSNRSLTLQNVELTGNATYGSGGGLHASGSAVVVIDGGTGSGNFADVGAVAAFFVGGAAAHSTIASSAFSSNTGYDTGSVLFVGSGFVDASASQFTDNDAGNGAAVAIDEYGSYASDTVTYRNNQAHDIEVTGHTCSVSDKEAVFECRDAFGDAACSPSTVCD